MACLQSSCWLELGFHLGGDILPNSCICWQNYVLCDCKTEEFCFLMAVGHKFSASISELQFLATWRSDMAIRFLKFGKEVRDFSKVRAIILCSVITIIYIPSPLLHFIS